MAEVVDTQGEQSTATASGRWMRRYVRRLRLADAAVLAYAIVGTHLLWFGPSSPHVASAQRFRISYVLVSAGLWLAWMGSLAVTETRDPRVLGDGAEEYQRVLVASVRLFGVIAIVAFLAQMQIARGYLAIAFPIGVAGLVVERWMWRQYLVLRRRVGDWSHRVLLVGDAVDLVPLAAELRRRPESGLVIVGACVPQDTADRWRAQDGLPPVLGGVTDVLTTAQAHHVDAVAVAASRGVPAWALRRIGWSLEGSGIDLLVAPALTNVAGPRIHVRPMGGLPLLHVEEPRLPRAGQLLKDAFDVVGAATLVALLSPVLVAVSIAVRLSGPGGVFFRQERVGKDGSTFRVRKFRSMRQDADDELQALLAAQGRADRPLFKVDDDPRVTAVGRFLRKYSLDELPQLFNVVAGDMSLVGPRPQRAEEVALYDDEAQRRLLAKPGMTGLWQVSGRSDLPWEEAVRLDLYYVENWSFAVDLVLLWRTLFAVVRGRGAY